ncbi:MAG: FecR domain-containing protein [Saprospiraceae bacterium]
MSDNNYILLIEKDFFGDIDASEKRLLESWLAESSDNRNTANEYRSILQATESAEPEMEIDLDAKFEEMMLRSGSKENGKVVSFKWQKTWWAAAASVLLVVSLFFVIRNLGGNEDVDWNIHLAQNEEFFILPDGSKIHLQTGASVEFPTAFSESERMINFKGNAFFEIAKDPSKPFTIQMPEAKVQILGTSFEIKASEPEGTTVHVFEGKVAFSNEKDSLHLRAGQKAIIQSGNSTPERIAAPKANELAWHTKKLVFQNTPLKEALMEISTAYHKQIRLTNPDMENCPLDATFDQQDLPAVLATIGQIFSLEIKNNEDGIILVTGGICP